MELVDIVGNYVFPIAVTVYLLWERRNIIDQLRTAVENNTVATNEMVAALRAK